MQSNASSEPQQLPQADLEFFRVFLPYELRLAQRRALRFASAPDEALPKSFVGLFLARLEPTEGSDFPSEGDGGNRIGSHIEEVLRSALRDSDIAGKLSNQEHLAVVRDLDPQQAYVVAQRFLAAAGRSQVLDAAALRTRLGYVIYPLTTQPNFPAQQWSTLLELARRLSARCETTAPAAGFGVLRGPEMAQASIPESDLVPLLFHDPESLVEAGMLRLQRIHILPGL